MNEVVEALLVASAEGPWVCDYLWLSPNWGAERVRKDLNFDENDLQRRTITLSDLTEGILYLLQMPLDFVQPNLATSILVHTDFSTSRDTCCISLTSCTESQRIGSSISHPPTAIRLNPHHDPTLVAFTLTHARPNATVDLFNLNVFVQSLG
jgi:hypothetical protein